MFWKRPMKFQELVRKVYPNGKVNPHLFSYFGEMRLDRITSLMIEDYKTQRLQTVKPSSVNRELSAIKHSFNQAILWGLASKNPMRGIKMLKETPKDRWLTYAEEERLLSESPDWLKPIILVDINTGLRLSEILNLEWSDVDLIGRTLTVSKSKNGEPRIIPLNSPTYQVLNSLTQSEMTDKVFNRGPSYVSHAFRKVCKLVGLVDVTFHTLRHTFATRLTQHNVNVFAIQKLMGHKTLAMTERYSHHSIASLKPYVEQLIYVNE